jgi:hypothetical protein
MYKLNNNDYKKILEYYKQNIPKSNRLLKLNAEKLLGEKLCRCIKKLDPINEARSIGICTKTILNNKGFTRGKFTCKKKRSITIKKYKNLQ